MRFVFKFISLSALFFLFSGAALAQKPPTIRIALLKDIDSLTIRGEELRLLAPEEKPVNTFLTSPAHIRPVDDVIQIGQDQYNFGFVAISDAHGKLQLDGKTFAGSIEVRNMGGGKLLVINELPLEKYLVGLIHGELNASWPLETIKAQAVAARTYALYTRKKNLKPLYDLETNHLDQVYVGSKGDKDLIVEEAIKQTDGEVLWFLGVYPGYYHSDCGGQTELSKNVWGGSEPSSSIVDSYCKNSPAHRWRLTISKKELLQSLTPHGLEGKVIRNISAELRDDSSRNALVSIETDAATLYLKATDLRRILGYNRLKSTWFQVAANADGIDFIGYGHGHGVGLCQWGAKTMAEKGFNYRSILKFYYPKAEVRKIYESHAGNI
ncbi:MAG: SpoIID/LytB domain-containing protein [Deltaproteobacteria bacterium]|nr:SpoIID/LytB domain-containing protein [Deltaproteobacteria bacterium]